MWLIFLLILTHQTDFWSEKVEEITAEYIPADDQSAVNECGVSRNKS